MELDTKVQAWKNIINKKKNISEYSCIQRDEAVIKVGSEYIWVWWVAIIEPENKEILGMSISKERNMFVAERFISEVVDEHGKHLVSTDMVVLGIHHKHVNSWR